MALVFWLGVMVELSLNWVGSVSFWICLVYGIETCLVASNAFVACLFIVWSCFSGSDQSGSDCNFGGSCHTCLLVSSASLPRRKPG